MKKSLFVVLVLVILSAMVLAACGGTSATTAAKTRPAAPAAFASKTNPLAGNADAAAKGKVTYTNLCISCHGATGLGDGPAGKALNPPAANLTAAVKEADAAYLFWRISEGGAMDPFKSSMPAHKSTLSEEQIWQVVTYIQGWK
jgi:mono/diheme cytochrome c family protein